MKMIPPNHQVLPVLIWQAIIKCHTYFSQLGNFLFVIYLMYVLLFPGAKSGVGGRRKRYQVSGSGKNITTKHDAEVCGRKNAKKIEKVCDKESGLYQSILWRCCWKGKWQALVHLLYLMVYSKGSHLVGRLDISQGLLHTSITSV